jgi:hypothetical protein
MILKIQLNPHTLQVKQEWRKLMQLTRNSELVLKWKVFSWLKERAIKLELSLPFDPDIHTTALFSCPFLSSSIQFLTIAKKKGKMEGIT